MLLSGFVDPTISLKDYNQVNRGRGSGGLVTMWKKSLTKFVSKIPCDNFRIQGTKFNLSEPANGNLNKCQSFLLLNTYFMCKPNTINFDEGPLLLLLEDIRRVIELFECRNIFWCGDLNTDLNSSQPFTDIIKLIIDQHNLTVFWSCPDATPGHEVQQVMYTYTQNLSLIHI